MATKKKAKQAKKAKKIRKPAPAASKKSGRRVAAKKPTAKAKPVRKAAPARRAPAPAKKKRAVVAAPKKASAPAKKAPGRKASKPKAAPAARAKPLMRREDRAGHLDPRYAAELRSRVDREPTEPRGFISRARSKDDLVEELGEEFVGTATSGEYEGQDAQNLYVTEERGGPFVETTANQEFARGTDASNPKGSTREPFPRT
jgi:hypothetical protein